MALTDVGVNWRERGREKIERGIKSVGDTAKVTADKIKSSGIATNEVGRKSEIAADGIKDFADSMARGDGVAGALINTISPLTSGFFALGTTLSMGIAAVIPFVIMGLASLIGESETLTDKIEELDSAFSAYNEAAKNATMSTAELQEKYGSTWQEAKKLLDIQYELSRLKLMDELAESISNLNSSLAGTGILYAGVQESIRGLATHFGVTTEQAALLRDKLLDIAEAKTFEEEVAAAKAFVAVIEEAGIKLEDLPSAVREQYNEVVKLLDKHLEVNNAIDATDGSIGAASSSTVAWANEMRNVASAAVAAANAVSASIAGIEAQITDAQNRAAALRAGLLEEQGSALAHYSPAAADDPKADRMVGVLRDQADRKRAADEALEKLREELSKPAKSAGGGGGKSGGGGGGGKSATAKQTDEQKELAKGLKEVEGNVDDTKAAYLEWYDGMSEGMSSTSDLMTTAFNGMEDAFVEFVKTGKVDFSSLVDSMISDLARYAFRAATMQAMTSFLPNLFGSSSAVLESAGPLARPTSMAFNGAIVNHPTKFFANGGLASMSEKSAEAIMPLTRNSRGQLGVYSDGGSGGGYVINLSPTINIEGSGDSQADMMKGAKEFNKLIENKVVDVMAKQGRSRLYRG